MAAPPETLLEDLLARAVERMMRDDRHLLLADCGEPAITHRIAVYLERFIDGEDLDRRYDVGCEYNRDGYDPKALDLKGMDPSRVRPDVIVHCRGTNEHNRIVLEVKKGPDDGGDFRKLRAFRDQLRYSVIAHLALRHPSYMHPHEPVGATLSFGSGRVRAFGEAPLPPRANWFLPIGPPAR